MKPPRRPRTGGGAPVVHLACSRGGHLDLLLALQPAIAGCHPVWVTQRSARAGELARAGAEVHILGEYRRGGLALVGTIWRSVALIIRQRPRLVVSTGAGIVVPFCVLARLGGARIVFVETSARVRGPSSSGRVLSRVANAVIAQWEEMRAIYGGAVIARSSVVRGLAKSPPSPGVGTFVGVGTHSQPFDRLLRLVDRALEDGILPRPATVQTGVSELRPHLAEVRDLLSPDEMESAIRDARYVVSHAGTGTISTALRAGRRPLILPRLARHGEHYDDHQQQIVDKLAALDLVVRLGDVITAADLVRADRPLSMPPELERLPPIVDCLRQHVVAAFPELAEA